MQVDPQGFLVAVDRGRGDGFTANSRAANTGDDGCDDLNAKGEQRGELSGPLPVPRAPRGWIRVEIRDHFAHRGANQQSDGGNVTGGIGEMHPSRSIFDICRMCTSTGTAPRPNACTAAVELFASANPHTAPGLLSAADSSVFVPPHPKQLFWRHRRILQTRPPSAGTTRKCLLKAIIASQSVTGPGVRLLPEPTDQAREMRCQAA